MQPEVRERYLEAGHIAADVRESCKAFIKPGISLLGLAEKIEELIRSKGAEPVFPANLSLNNIAAHYTPWQMDETKLSESDILKVDIGVHVDGYIGDTAFTISFDERHDKLIAASKSALDEAIKLCKPGALLSDISAKIEETIKGFGFVPIRNLTGHGLGQYDLHAEPQVPNIKFSSDYRLQEGMVIALEPFATDGAGAIKDSDDAFIFSIGRTGAARNPDARRIIAYADRFNGMPFAERWLFSGQAKESGVPDSLVKIRLAMRELRMRGMLHEYPVLKEIGNGLISQAEHTVIVDDEPVVTTL